MLVVISGPTATGKSALAVDLAQRVQGVILGADSRQIYQEFNIGTAKPDATARTQVWHQLIDWVSPRRTVTVAEYQATAETLIRNWHAMGVIPFLVGGTGLYIQAITAGLRIPQVPPQPELRQELTHIGQTTCYAWLQQVDVDSAARIHPHDQVRTLR
ncbi:MAG: tRNA (adenosine(37)-N6)-dimethylallyltransferase MiaA, partial [Gloeomargaritaceae cyanobacterium C42_A2020_066]|nr:tRNA (adenosine(37)-N6)-dimethylallyltransferase MiaA [Gloeomargaritaceae cyanobacterium C42_A2020_066]